MKILGIDTTTKFLSLGVYDNANPVRNTIYNKGYSKISNGAKIYEYNLDLGRRHSNLLMVTIKRVLDALGWDARDIDYFACGTGPGSFTGIRIGIATIKGLSFSLNKPVIGISTLDILARNAGITDDPIVPIIDARRSLIYCSVYRKKNNILRRMMPYMLLTEEEFFKKAGNNAVLLGDAVNLYKQKILENIKGATILEKEHWYPKGRSIVELALERIKNNKIDNPFELAPIYLYPKECQIQSQITQIKRNRLHRLK